MFWFSRECTWTVAIHLSAFNNPPVGSNIAWWVSECCSIGNFFFKASLSKYSYATFKLPKCFFIDWILGYGWSSKDNNPVFLINSKKHHQKKVLNILLYTIWKNDFAFSCDTNYSRNKTFH